MATNLVPRVSLLSLLWSLEYIYTAVKRKSMRNALVPGRRPRKFPAPKFNIDTDLIPYQNRCHGKKRLNDSD